eukprot:gene5010-34796_t
MDCVDCGGLRIQESNSIVGWAGTPVIGGGLAGVATAYHIIKLADKGHAVEVHLYDQVGIAAGASGAAAGLLHPLNPKGKALWKGLEAMDAALELVDAAQRSAESCGAPPFVWQNGLVRPTGSFKQALDFKKTCDHAGERLQSNWEQQDDSKARSGSDLMRVRGLSLPQLKSAVPGVRVNPWMQETLSRKDSGHAGPSQAVPELKSESVRRSEAELNYTAASKGDQAGDSESSAAGTDAIFFPSVSGASGISSPNLNQKPEQEMMRASTEAQSLSLDTENCAAWGIPKGMVVSVPSYLEHLWSACKDMAAAREDGSIAQLHVGTAVESLRDLEVNEGPFVAIVVATGAATEAISELAAADLPLDLCQGYSLTMRPSTPEALYPAGAPSVLGQTYLSSQGSEQLIVGASKSYGWSAAQSKEMCLPQYSLAWKIASASNTSGDGDSAEASTTAASASISTAPALNASGDGDSAEASNAASISTVSLLNLSELKSGAERARIRLISEASSIWAPLADWEVTEIRLEDDQVEGGGGSGGGGGVAKHLASAMVTVQESQIPAELLGWKTAK